MSSETNFPIYRREKMTYALESISDTTVLLANKVTTLSDIINDMFVRKVGYDIEFTLTGWINEWKKIDCIGALENQRCQFIEELTDLLFQIKDNLIENLKEKLESKAKALPGDRV